MNYLQLCQRLRQEAGLSGTGPSAVTGQTGEALRIVNWIDAAYNDIQSEHATWRFLRDDFDFTTDAGGVQEYSPTDVGITDHASWVLSDMRVYESASDESDLTYMPWEDFRYLYLKGSSRTQEGRPTHFSVKPDGSLIFYPIPEDDSYTIDGEHYKTPDVMEEDEDSPVFPVRFHMSIAWKGLMHYGAYAGAPEKYDHGKIEFRKLFNQLMFDQLEKPSFGGPLA